MFFTILAAAMSLSDEEQSQMERWVSTIDVTLFVMVAALLIFAVAIRYIARHTTRPCGSCMEFISKKAAVCPRCGKTVSP